MGTGRGRASWRISLDEIRAELADLERQQGESWLARREEQIARGRRWLELGGDQERFAALAADKESRSMYPPEVGGLWWLAGNVERSRACCRQVDRGKWARRSTVAGALYLLGEFDKAQEWGSEDVTPAIELAQVRLSGEWERLAGIRERLILPYITGPGGGPHASYHGEPLTGWDWLEESFRLAAELRGIAPFSHEQMLREAGVLSDEPMPGPPVPRAPVVGTSLAGAHGVRLDVVDEDTVVLGRTHERHLWVSRLFGLWDASVMEPDGDRVETLCDAVFADWRHAASEGARIFARDWDREAGEEMARLAIEADGDAGTPVMAPPPEPDPEPPVDIPYLISRDESEIIFTLADDLYARLRRVDGRWWGGVSDDLIAPDEVAFRKARGTWRDAAQQLSKWLKKHRGGRGVAELEQILADPRGRARGCDPDWL